MQENGIFHKAKRFASGLVFGPIRFVRDLCAIVGFFTLLSVFCLGIYVASFFRTIPDIKSLKFAGVKSISQQVIQNRLEDKSKRYRWAEIGDIHRDLLYAIVLAEDSEFFEHGGIAVDAMLQSLVENLRKKKIQSGGSTITQQTVKNVFLSSERSLQRKLKEILISQRMEENLTKNEILELYLNIAEFGPDIIGVNAAAHYYFKKTPSEINAAEGAFLAIMLPSPRKYHYAVFENHNLARSHRNKIRRILGDMLFNEFISVGQYNAYLNYPYFQDSLNLVSEKKLIPRRSIASKPLRSKKAR